MSDNIEFPNGIMVKQPNAKAPDFIKGQISIKSAEAIQWIQTQNSEWINLDIKVSKQNKWYLSKNDWKPQNGGGNNQQSASNAGSENMNNKDWENQGFSQVDPDQPF